MIRRGLGAAVLALAAAALALPAAANAAAPADLTVQVMEPYKLTAQWSLPPGMDTSRIEIATSQDFTAPVVDDALPASQTTYTSKQFAQGAYWVKVAVVPTGCSAPCVEEFTDPVPATIPTPPAPLLSSVGQMGRYVTAAWSIDPGVVSDVIEVAKSPETDPGTGAFLVENLALRDLVDPGATEYTSSDQVPAGVYYVHVGASDPLCSAGICPDVFSEVSLLGVPPDPEVHPAFTPPLPKPKPDTATHFSAIKCAAKQKAGSLVVQASMLETGTITVTGALSVPNLAKAFKLKAVSVGVTAYHLVRITLKLPAKVLRAAKRALKRHRTVRARLTLTARDGVGNTTSENRGIKLKR